MQQLKRDGIALFYEEAGKGAPPILLVHGLAGDHTFMTPQFEHFRRNHRVVSVDLRGHGLSDSPTDGYAPDTLAGDAIAVAEGSGLLEPGESALDGSGSEGGVVLAGHGFGAIVAAWTAARLGRRCTGLHHLPLVLLFSRDR